MVESWKGVSTLVILAIIIPFNVIFVINKLKTKIGIRTPYKNVPGELLRRRGLLILSVPQALEFYSSLETRVYLRSRKGMPKTAVLQ